MGALLIGERTEALYALDPMDLGAWFDDGPVPGDNKVKLHTASEALAASGASAVLDGAMFDAPAYRKGGPGTLRFALLANGADHDGGAATDRQGATLAIVNGGAIVYDGDHVPEQATFSAQMYPALVRRGTIVASSTHNMQRVWRAGVGVMRDGRVCFAVFHGSMYVFAAWGQEHGCVELLYTDGGGSAILALSAGVRFGSTEDRPVALYMTAR